ncbi:MAG: hypothetical protein H8D67_30925 [Deltaproteobacteria bacterium]|nr:hypothetical protein [Deltaproteobacteria bacterium]
MDDKTVPIPLSIDVTWSLLGRIEKAACWQRVSIGTFLKLAIEDRLDDVEIAMGEME